MAAGSFRKRNERRWASPKPFILGHLAHTQKHLCVQGWFATAAERASHDNWQLQRVYCTAPGQGFTDVSLAGQGFVPAGEI